MSRPICAGIRKDGAACRAPSVPGLDLCWVHDPGWAERAREARSRGAATASKLRSLRGRLPRLATSGELLRFNAGLVHRLLAGELEPDVARVAVNALGLQRQLVESGDLEKRLAQLEAVYAATGQRNVR